MPTSKMCPHTVTVFNCCGENDSGQAIYQAAVLQNVQVIHQEGEGKSTTLDDEIKVYIFDENYTAVTPSGDYIAYIDFRSWVKMDAEDREGYWTLNPSGQDYIAIGTYTTNDGLIPDPGDVALFEIKKIARTEIGSFRMWHWEVIAL